jgi:hypothetical protein
LDNDSDTAITVLDDLAVRAGLECPAMIAAGQWIEIGSYCQVSLASLTAGNVPAGRRRARFPIDGTALASAVLVSRMPEHGRARDHGAREGATPDLANAHRLLVTCCPILLRIREGVVTGLRAGGEDSRTGGADLTSVVRTAMGAGGDPGELYVRDVSLGTNDAIRPHVNWNINSPMHAGAGTVRITIGTDGADRQIDFIMAPPLKTTQPLEKRSGRAISRPRSAEAV